MKNTVAFLCGSLLTLSAFAQSLPVGTPVLEEAWRRNQLRGGKDSNTSFTVRPLQSTNGNFSQLYATDSFSFGNAVVFAKNSKLVRLLPAMLEQQFSLHHPYGWNDGSLIPAKGYQVRLSAGAYAQAGPLSIQLRPEFVFAQNAPFISILSDKSDEILKTYYHYVLNKIDQPERFGAGAYAKLFPGQSSVRVNLKKLSFGVSTENLWWGPGVRNALVMSNTAPGFPHLTLNTTAPLLSPVGSFEGQIVSGLLKNSGYLPDTTKTVNGEQLFAPKPADDRYLNGMVLSWQPKWTKGLFLGLSRVYYVYRQDLQHSLNGYLPIIGKLFKGSGIGEDTLRRDELLSVFFRLLLPKEQAEIYAEFGRNDHSANMRDLLLEPEHSRAYLFGFRKLFSKANRTDLELMAEFTNLQVPSTFQVRELESWYAHYQVRDGYTNQGQVIGAGIGPGSNSQTVGLHWLNGIASKGFLLERVVHNNDFYYAAFSPQRDFGSHWVDLSINLNKSWQHKRFLYDAWLILAKSLNYQWKRNRDVHFLQAGFTASYLF